MEVGPPSSRSVQLVKQRDKYVLNKKKPLKSEIKRRVYITDVRRTYAQMMLNIINSFDIEAVEAALNEYCTPDITTVSCYDGGQNPTGANSIETTTIPGHITYWTMLFKSAPDFVFETSFLTAYKDPVTGICLVRCKFVMTGTRIVDVKVAQKVSAETSKKRKRISSKRKYATSEADLMAQIHEQLAASYSTRAATDDALLDGGSDLLNEDLYLDNSLAFPPPAEPMLAGPDEIAITRDLLGEHEPSTSSPAASAVPDAPVAGKRRGRGKAQSTMDEEEEEELCEKMSSMFESGQAVVFTENATVEIDPQPLPQALKLHYTGTFTVYLDEANKICRFEFIYQVANPAGDPSADTSTTSTASGGSDRGSSADNVGKVASGGGELGGV